MCWKTDKKGGRAIEREGVMKKKEREGERMGGREGETDQCH